ncbi:MAG: DNRLRE domain-containing protein [Syntrophomonas sp.]
MQNTLFNPIQNVYIASAYPNQNFANPPYDNVLFAGTFSGATDIYRSLLQFDIFDPNRGIPPNSTVRAATLTLTCFRNDNLGIAQVIGYRLLNFFNQNTVTFNTAPLSYYPSPTFSFIAPVLGSPTVDVTSLVQGWYSGAYANNGIELRGIEDANDNIVAMRSNRFEDSDFWPKLNVTWVKGTLSYPITDTLTGAPNASTFIDMTGAEQATWLIYNPTTTAVSGVVQVQQGSLLINTSTVFTVPAGQTGIVDFTGAVNTARLFINSAGATDTYTISAEIRDE